MPWVEFQPNDPITGDPMFVGGYEPATQTDIEAAMAAGQTGGAFVGAWNPKQRPVIIGRNTDNELNVEQAEADISYFQSWNAPPEAIAAIQARVDFLKSINAPASPLYMTPGAQQTVVQDTIAAAANQALTTVAVNYEDGTFITDPSGNLFIMGDGTKHAIPDEATFETLGGHWETVIRLYAEQFNSIAEGDKIQSVTPVENPKTTSAIAGASIGENIMTGDRTKIPPTPVIPKNVIPLVIVIVLILLVMVAK